MTSLRAPLDGIRVLELGSFVGGPAAGRILADLGADVIKIEPPEGDGLREWGLPAPDGTSWWFKALNRNKRFGCFDLHELDDLQTVREIALAADVLVENYRPGRLDDWGLGFEALHRRNPRLIYASISGYGQSGPYRERAGYGNVSESVGGIRYVTGYPDAPPVRVGFGLDDELAALHCVIGVLAALHARERDGVGEYVDVSTLESCMSMLQGALPEYLALGVVRERSGNQHNAVAPSNVYETRDGRYLVIGANTDAVFRRFAAVMGQPDLARDPRFKTNRDRLMHTAEIDAVVAAWTKTIDADDAIRLLSSASVPAGPINSVADIVKDEQVRARHAIGMLPDDTGNQVGALAPVPRMRLHANVLSHAGRSLGADTEAIRREFPVGQAGAVPLPE